MQLKRKRFLRQIRRVSPRKLVFLDEAGLHAAMTRSHVWVKKGTEYIERTPMNWGDNLTLLGAIRMSGWVILSSMFKTVNKERFVVWLKKRLLRRLRKGDVLVLDNLPALPVSRDAQAAEVTKDLARREYQGRCPTSCRDGRSSACFTRSRRCV